MHMQINGNWKTGICRFVPIFVLAAAFLLVGFADSGVAAAKKSAQETFNSPEEAVKALFTAVKNKDPKKIMAVFGRGGRDLVYSGDPVADSGTAERVAKAYEENNRLVKAGDRKAVLEIGKDNWPLPIPIVEQDGKWRFDTRAGREEILNRRIGKNELGAIEICRSYVEAQKEYAAEPRDGSGSPAYAQKFVSAPGKRDGLYWEAAQGEPQSPIGIFMANARQEGYKKGGKPAPYHGYFFRILKAQGKNASGGAYDYVAKGRMIGGFGLIAYPAKYGSSGIMTFMVNQEGAVYQKDLGRGTLRGAQAIKLFDPDKGWRKVE